MSTSLARAQRWTTVLDSDRLHLLRLQHGLSQAELARKAGISLATLAQLERQPAAGAAAAPWGAWPAPWAKTQPPFCPGPALLPRTPPSSQDHAGIATPAARPRNALPQ